MEKEKQIEEMANALYENRPYTDLWEEDARDIAEVLYGAGYRRQYRWISVEEALPEKYGDYCCYTKYGSLLWLTYNPKYKLFNVSFDNVEDAIEVDYWAEIFIEPPNMEGGEE